MLQTQSYLPQPDYTENSQVPYPDHNDVHTGSIRFHSAYGVLQHYYYLGKHTEDYFSQNSKLYFKQ